MSERTHAEVEIASHDAIDFEPILGEDATITLDGGESRRWTLKLGRATFLGDTDSSLRFRLDLYDAAWLLGFSKSTRKFRGMSAQKIVTRVLDEGRIAHRWTTITDTPERKYCAQYRETNLAFVERLLEFEGIYYSFDPDGVMVLGDISDASPLLRETPFELIEAAGALTRGEVGIHTLRKGRRVSAGRVTLGDYNWKKPALALRECAAAEHDTLLERYDYPAGYRLPDQGARLAQMRLEAERVQARFIEGKGNVPTFAPARGFSVGSRCGDMFAGDYLLVRVEHRFNNGEFKSAGGAMNGAGETMYENRFVGMPLSSRFRPLPKTPRPRVGGTHTATVRGPGGEAVHTDQYGRFRAQFHWDREGTETDQDSRWLRALQETSTSMTLARTGWEVFVGYIDGDPDRPIGLGRAINGALVPTYALPGNKNMMAIKTPSVGGGGGGFNEIKMDDSAGSQMLSVQAEKDLDALVKNEKTEKIGNNETHSVGTDFTREVAKNQAIKIGADATASYGAERKLEVDGDRRKAVGGAEAVKIGQSAQTLTGGDEREKVGSLRLTVAGAIKPPDFNMLVERAKALGIGLLRNASPALTAAVESAMSIKNRVEGLTHDGGNALISGATSAVQTGARAGQDALLGMAGTTLGQAITAGGGGAESAVGAGLSGALGAATGALQQGLQGTLDRVLPTQRELGALIPSQRWIPTGEGLQRAFDNTANAALDQIRQQLNIEAAINLLCDGGIARSATASMHKTVGGAYLTVAVLGIDTRIGYGYLETIGGMKLTLAKLAISEEVTGRISVTVGGAIRRHSVCYLIISAGKNSKVTAGPLASYVADHRFDVLGDVIEINATSSVTMKGGGGAEVSFGRGSVELKGKMKLTAGKVITLFGGSKLNVT